MGTARALGWAVVLTLGGVALSGCRSARAEVRPETRGDAPAGSGFLGEGYASFYGAGLQSRLTANGERFDKNGFTAAHRKLRFGSCLEVENLANARRVKVRVNDRGPYVGNRIIDVSEAAARELGMLDRGVTRVRLYACG